MTLKIILRANATSCIVFGLIFLCIPINTAVFLAGDKPIPEIILQVLGMALLANGAHLLWASLKVLPSKLLIFYFSTGDFIWAIGSIILLIIGIGITTTLGIFTSLLIALMVTVLGTLQLIKRKQFNMHH